MNPEHLSWDKKTAKIRRPSLKERFDAKWVLDGGCWRWTDALAANGYGYLGVGGRAGRKIQAHRLAYELYVGPIPDGLHVDHLCRNRWCVRPQHLEAVTQRENLLRGKHPLMIAHRTGICVRGHDMSLVGRRGGRQCAECCRVNQRANRMKKRAAA